MKCSKGRGPSAASVIADIRNRNLGWYKAIAELVDNAVGNGATTIKVRLQPTRFEVLDNGVGCDADKLAAMVSIGWHQEDELVDNPVSRYGVGAKHAFIWAGGPTEIYTARDGVHRAYVVDWDDFGDEWDYPDPIEDDKAVAACEGKLLGQHGVTIVVPHHTRTLTEAIFTKSILPRLDKAYWAAVETGVEINVQFKPRGKRKKPIGRNLVGKALPKFVDGAVVDTIASLADGRQVKIIGGVLDPSERITDPGFEYIYGHRVVIEAGGVGAGNLDFERVYARVVLLGDKGEWQVETNKTGVHDTDEAALGEAVFRVCEGILEKSATQDYETILEQELCDELSNMVTAANRKRAKRRPGDSNGTQHPTGTGTQHTNAAETQDIEGNCKSRGSTANIGLRFSEFSDEDAHLLGKANVKDRKVRLNKLHKYVVDAYDRRDKFALLTIAYAVWSQEWTRKDANNQVLMFGRGEFIEKFSAMLKEFPEDVPRADYKNALV